MAAEHDPALAAADRLLLMPGPLPPLAVRQQDDRAHERHDDAVPRPGRRALGRRPARASRHPDRRLPGGRRARHAAGRRHGGDRRRDRARQGDRRRRRRRTTPAPPSPPCRSQRPGSIFLSVGTWSLVGVELDEPLITDETFAANLTNEGGVAGTTRLLRNVTGLWLLHECRRAWAEQGQTLLVRASSSSSPGRRPPLRLVHRPERGRLPRARRHAAADRRLLRATAQSSPAGVRRDGRALRAREPRAQARARRSTCSGASPASTRASCTSSAAARATRCSAQWTASAAGLPVLAGPEEATLLGNLLVQAMALGEIASIDEARVVVRARSRRRSTSRAATSDWPEAPRAVRALLAGAGLEVSGVSDTLGALRGIPAPASRWDDAAAAGLSVLDGLVYRSNLLGADRALANIGGGNTSAKEIGRRPHGPRDRAFSGSRARAPTSRRSPPPASPGLRLDELLPLRERARDGRRGDGRLPAALRDAARPAAPVDRDAPARVHPGGRTSTTRIRTP